MAEVAGGRFREAVWLWVYVLCYSLLLPFAMLRQWWRGRREPLYRETPLARFGVIGEGPETGGIWVHAVSVGETVAAIPMIHALSALPGRPPVTLTVTTAAGRERALSLLGYDVFLTWMPWDLPWAVRSFLARVRPRQLVLMETELWPVLIRECARTGVRIVLVNARLSARSARGYRTIPGIVRPMLEAIELIACQDEASGRRFAELGVPPARIICPGNIKFDTALPGDLSLRMDLVRDRLGDHDGPLLIAGSTHPGEERLLLQGLLPVLRRHPDWRLLIVPRHPARFEAVWKLLEQCGLPAARYSAGTVPATARVILGDVLGELMALYGVADLAFIGGSLVDAGGHNPIEPAWHGIPLFMGPHVANFADVVERFRAAGALEQHPDAIELGAAMESVLLDDASWQRRGDQARAVIEANQGALGTVLAAMRPG